MHLSILGADGRSLVQDNNRTMLPVGTAMRLRVKNALAMKKPKTEVSRVGAGESVYSPFGTLNIQNWGTYGEGDSNFCIN